jgi:hypothetical protein
MKLKLTQKELENLATGAIKSAKRLGLPLKKRSARNYTSSLKDNCSYDCSTHEDQTSVTGEENNQTNDSITRNPSS